jgi:hypothetical protein
MRVMKAALAFCLCGAGVVLILLSTGALAAGHGAPSRVHGSATRDPNPITARNASDTVAQAQKSVGGVEWTASTYTNALGHCAEVGSSEGSVSGCSSTASFTWSVGDVSVGDTEYRIAQGLAPAGAATARVELGDGSTVSPTRSYVGKGVWFVVYPAVLGAAGDDVSRIQLLDAAGEVVDSATPPAISDYERAAQEQQTP